MKYGRGLDTWEAWNGLCLRLHRTTVSPRRLRSDSDAGEMQTGVKRTVAALVVLVLVIYVGFYVLMAKV